MTSSVEAPRLACLPGSDGLASPKYCPRLVNFKPPKPSTLDLLQPFIYPKLIRVEGTFRGTDLEMAIPG